MSLWKDTKRGNAQKLIDWLLSVKTDGGWPVNWVNKIAFAELSSSSTPLNLTQGNIMRVLGEMSKSNKRSVDDFEAIYKQVLKAKAIDARRRVGRWKFFIPVELTLNSDLHQRPRILILGKVFTFLLIRSVERQLDTKTKAQLRDPDAIRAHTGIKVEQPPEVFLSVSSRASSWSLAWKEVTPAFDALRGLLELSLDFYVWQHTFGAKIVRRKVPHPLWMIGYKKGEPPSWVYFITEEGSTTKTFDLTNSRLSAIKKNAKILQKTPRPRSTKSLIADCLRLYAQAMDARFRHLCFLGFWQLAEVITRSDTVGGNTDKVVARLVWHGSRAGLKASGYKYALKALGKIRNDIVHRGIHEVEDDDINILKFVCEGALTWLFRAHKSLPTMAHVEHYYRLREINQTDFEAIKDSLAYMKKQKSK